MGRLEASAYLIALPSAWLTGPLTAVLVALTDRVPALVVPAVVSGVVLVSASLVLTLLAIRLRADFSRRSRFGLTGYQQAWYELILGGYVRDARAVLCPSAEGD